MMNWCFILAITRPSLWKIYTSDSTDKQTAIHFLINCWNKQIISSTARSCQLFFAKSNIQLTGTECQIEQFIRRIIPIFRALLSIRKETGCSARPKSSDVCKIVTHTVLDGFE